MKVIAIVQARMGSTRLPNKVMMPILGVPMIGLLLQRLSQSQEIDQVIVATSVDVRNRVLVDYVNSLGYPCEEGSEDDVLARYYDTAFKHGADVVVRITGDCPLVDPMLVDGCVAEFNRLNIDYLSNASPATYPDGLDIEVFTFSALERAYTEAQGDFYREHVTPYFREPQKFNVVSVSHKEDLSYFRWTVDEPLDFQLIEDIFKHFHPQTQFSWLDVLSLSEIRPEIFARNQTIKRNQGAFMRSGQKLWSRAKQIIPGGNMLLSKRGEMFLPDHWPNYFSKAKGCRVWGLDGTEYIDMSSMGVGTNTLGYGHDEIDSAVIQTVRNGNMSTLNCPEEVYLAEKLLEMHPWADMVRFARTGGEANAVGVRIARAASGKENIAICGYHGWHDWYLATNLSGKEGLDGHLLPGLEPHGVPSALLGTTLPFRYNDFEGLEYIVNNHDIGVIKMEVVRNLGPEDGFLHKVRKLASDRGIVLIFDECTSGFRETFGGLHTKYQVEPDMAIFGKALGNGYAITAVIGKRSVMEAAQTTFISSTFWTERIGPTAGLATLKVMQEMESWTQITNIGIKVTKGWQELARAYGLEIETSGLPSLTNLAFKGVNAAAYKTFMTQEMLKRGYLASTSFYACVAHTQEIIDAYFEALSPIFQKIKMCDEGLEVESLLDGQICHSGFKRLN